MGGVEARLGHAPMTEYRLGQSSRETLIDREAIIDAFYNEHAPMANVPREHKRQVSKERKVVAAHETKHIKGAYYVGARVLGVSVIPEGDSLGRTWVACDSAAAMQIVAFMGSHDTSEGSAMGYGSDLSKVGALSYHPDGLSVAQTRALAQNADSLFSDIEDRIADIIGFLGTVSGADINKVIAQAKFERELEQNQSLFDALLKTQQFSKKLPSHQNEETNVVSQIEDLPLGDTKITEVSVPERRVIKEIFICGKCRGRDGNHRKGCEIGIWQDIKD